MNITLTGHSFTRRLRDHLFSSLHNRSQGRPRRHGDVLHHHKQRAQLLAKKLRLSNHFKAAHTVSDKITFVTDILAAEQDILASQPDVLVIDIGSNDIAAYATVQPREMLSLAHKLHEFISALHVPLIIVNAVLPRTRRIAGSAQTFLQNSKHFNGILAELITTTPNVAYNKLRGFQFQASTSQDCPRPVHDWSDDGIHANQASMTAYQARIRHAVLDNCHIIARH
jgi:lysophospholipase L1-like esterase